MKMVDVEGPRQSRVHSSQTLPDQLVNEQRSCHPLVLVEQLPPKQNLQPEKEKRGTAMNGWVFPPPRSTITIKCNNSWLESLGRFGICNRCHWRIWSNCTSHAPLADAWIWVRGEGWHWLATYHQGWWLGSAHWHKMADQNFLSAKQTQWPK